MSYSSQAIDHCENPRNAGPLDRSDPVVGTGLVGAPACGDAMRLQITVNGEGVIGEARCKTSGCGSAIAAEDAIEAAIAGRRRNRGGEEEPCR